MAQETLLTAAELQWISQDDVTLEDYSFSLKTGLRGAGDFAALHTAMESFWSSLVGSGILNGATLRMTRYNNWETSGGFTGWHQLSSKPQSIAGGGVSRLPTQLAVVVTLTNQVYGAINLGRRRNRAFLGPCPASVIGGDGKVTTGNVTDIGTAMQDLHDDLQSATTALVGTNDGLCVISPTGDHNLHAEYWGVGRQMDTHRSRRQKGVEGITYTALT